MEEGQTRTRTVSEVDIPVLMPESKARKRAPRARWPLIVLLVLLVVGVIAWRYFRRAH